MRLLGGLLPQITEVRWQVIPGLLALILVQLNRFFDLLGRQRIALRVRAVKGLVRFPLLVRADVFHFVHFQQDAGVLVHLLNVLLVLLDAVAGVPVPFVRLGGIEAQLLGDLLDVFRRGLPSSVFLHKSPQQRLLLLVLARALHWHQGRLGALVAAEGARVLGPTLQVVVLLAHAQAL